VEDPVDAEADAELFSYGSTWMSEAAGLERFESESGSKL